jgi:spermidine synthase
VGNNDQDLPAETSHPRFDLFFVSFLLLFLELACIRWFASHVLYLTFFTNTVLLASFLGMSLGCLCSRQQRNYLISTPYLLLLALFLGVLVEVLGVLYGQVLDVGHQSSPQLVFFGTENRFNPLSTIHIPIELVAGLFFLLIALVFVGPGQLLGRALTAVPNRVQAYSLNILGSAAGTILFAGVSWWHLSPFWWFLPVVLGLAAWFWTNEPTLPVRRKIFSVFLLVLCLLVGSITSLNKYQNGSLLKECFWSPYYRVDFYPQSGVIEVNQIGHQGMIAQDKENALGYALPHLLNRDAGGKRFKDILIIGAGSGNDVSQALKQGSSDVHIDAVEIDPTIQSIGRRRHPDKPYGDDRVTVHLDDGRNFLRSTNKKYDLVVFALVDSLVLHSGYSSVRLESYLFTREALEDVKRHLKPDGMFVMYNFFRQGWIVVRLKHELETVFGKDNPLVLILPNLPILKSEDSLGESFTLLLAGDNSKIKQAFAKDNQYHVPHGQPLSSDSANGFTLSQADLNGRTWYFFGPAHIVEPQEPVRISTDDWPFLYLREPTIPLQPTLSGMALIGALSLFLIALLIPRGAASKGPFALDGRMFFLGAGFMLVETKAVVHMALLFGSTWMVNTVVFVAVFVMILLANLLVLKIKPERLWPYYLGLVIALLLNALIPLDSFLGLERVQQVIGSVSLVFAPIFFAAVVFAVSFSRTREADRALGANIAGAMVGGLAENFSMVLGFQRIVLLALLFYVLSMLWHKSASSNTDAT